MVAALSSSLYAGESLFTNSAFDADAAGWSWENWSAPGSAVAFDATQNSTVAGGVATSGSLKLVNAFTSVPGYQQAVYTVQLPAPQNFVGQIGSISFDVKVDATSTPRAGGDYGFLEVILRQGANWEWVTLPGVHLNGTDWQRVTFQVPKTGVDSIRAISVKLGENDFLGPVTLNIDNVAYATTPDDVAVTGVDNGTVGVAPDGWSWENWSAPGVVTFDALDTHGRSTSGSVKMEDTFNNDPTGYQQSVYTYVLPGGQVDAAQEYSYVNLDVKVDAASVPRASGDYGYFEVILRNGTGWDWLSTDVGGGVTGTRITNNVWTHISAKINPLASAVHRLTFKVGDGGLLGPITMNIDNITFTRNSAPPPPPTLGISAAKGGLTLVTTSTDQYGRHNIYTADNPDDPAYVSFVGSAEPVSYSFTLNTYPDATAYPGFQAHIFLVPGAPGTETAPDYTEPTLAFLDIRAGADGTGTATFRFKANQPNGNDHIYGGGDPHTSVNSTTVLGKWTLTVNGSIFTMTAPDGTVSAPVDIGADALAAFNDGGASPIRAYFGVQPNSVANKGQSVQVGGIEIKKGNQVIVSDNFNGPELDLSKWTVNASTGGILFVSPSDAGLIVTWTVPDTGFLLQAATTLSNPTWVNLDVNPATIGAMKQAVTPRSALPAGNQVYIRMIKPAAP